MRRLDLISLLIIPVVRVADFPGEPGLRIIDPQGGVFALAQAVKYF
jgi:hypothetical protein